MTKNSSKVSAFQQLGKNSRSLRFGDFFSRLPNLRKSQPHFEVVISPDQFAQSGPAPEKSLIFGASLHEILERAPFTTKGGLCIPLVLHRCFSEISKKGIRSEGLFRLSGSAPKIHQLENLFSREPDFGKNVDLSPYDVHTLAGTFKKLLRSLPEPVIPHHLHIYYLNGFNKSASDEENLAILSSLGHRMDAQHFDLLKYIIAVASYVEREQKNNKMTAEALAIVLAPTCTGLDGIINKLPVNKNKMTVSLGRASTSRPISSSNVLQLSIVKDLEQWTALFQFMITFHEELLNNWTGATDNEKQESDSASDIQSDTKSDELPPSPVSPKVEDVPSPVSPLTTDFRLSFEDFVLPELTLESLTSRENSSNVYEKTDIGSSNLSAPEDTSSAEGEPNFETELANEEKTAEEEPTLEAKPANEEKGTEEGPDLEDELVNEEKDVEITSESNEDPGNLQKVEENQEEKYAEKLADIFQPRRTNNLQAAAPRASKTPKEELKALRAGQGNKYTQLLRQWQSREEGSASKTLRSDKPTVSGVFGRSLLYVQSQISTSPVVSTPIVPLCVEKENIKKASTKKAESWLLAQSEQLQLQKLSSRLSTDSGVYSADGISLSDLE